MSETMNDISTAPYNEEVRVKVGEMTFLAKLVPNASVDMEGVACDQWQATRDGEYPRCWSDACCWSSNEDDVASIQPTGWLPS